MLVAKLDAVKVAIASGDIPQNVNFAINIRVVEAFLDAAAVAYSVAAPTHELASADVGEVECAATLPVICRR
jgi:hypothetical protein